MKRHLLALSLTCTALFVSACVAPLQTRGVTPDRQIIDMHLHAFPFDYYGTPPPPNPVSGAIPLAGTNDEAREATVAMMDRHGIVLAAISGPLEAVVDWKEKQPTRFLGGAYTSARYPLLEPKVLRQEIADSRLDFVGELGLQYRGLSPAAKELEPIFALAEELDVPVGIHTGISGPNTPFDGAPNFRVSLGNPLELEEILNRHPRLRVWLMHAGWPYLQETKAIMYVYPQVYADLSVINWVLPRAEFHDYLEDLIRVDGVESDISKRLMFGSDQMVWPDAIPLAIEGVDSAPFLTEAQKSDIFYNNAVRFLRLSDEELARHRAMRSQ